MNALSVLAATESVEHVVLPFHPIVFGLIAAVLFLSLGFVTWSYRNVASRHSQKWAGADSTNGHH
jgi:hypothetical protein